MAAALARIVFGVLYAYGALVHVLNMTGLRGFDWANAPLKWQALDVIYLVVDLAVVALLVLRPRLGFLGVAAAALSQILLYTLFRSWILDVPEAYALGEAELSYLNLLVAVHVVSLGVVGWLSRKLDRA